MASASSTVSVDMLPQPPRMPPLVKLPGKTVMTFWPEAGDLGLDLRLGAVADADHGDHRADADDDAERGEDGAHACCAAARAGRP